METKNRCTREEGTGKVIWISPEIAVVGVIIAESKDNSGNRVYHYLVEKRGQGAPDFKGKYCFPCGYYDYSDHYLKVGAAREVYEETGIKVDPREFHFAGINDGMYTNKGHITARFVTKVKCSPEELLKMADIDSVSRGGEEGESSQILVVTYDWIKEHREEFCFNHDKLADTIEKHSLDIFQNSFYKDNYDEEH